MWNISPPDEAFPVVIAGDTVTPTGEKGRDTQRCAGSLNLDNMLSFVVMVLYLEYVLAAYKLLQYQDVSRTSCQVSLFACIKMTTLLI